MKIAPQDIDQSQPKSYQATIQEPTSPKIFYAISVIMSSSENVLRRKKICEQSFHDELLQ